MVSFPYYLHIFRDSYGSGMGIVWETYHKGVPLLGVPENPTDIGTIGKGSLYLIRMYVYRKYLYRNSEYVYHVQFICMYMYRNSEQYSLIIYSLTKTSIFGNTM